MNAPAMEAVAPPEQHREAMLNLLKQAAEALESHDQAAFEDLIQTIGSLRETRLADGVARLARRVQQAMNQLDMDSRLACIAGREIPDARSHLDFVVRMTEDAAHRTLDLVDFTRTQIDDSRAILGKVRDGIDPEEDLSGQMIRRVIHLVQEIETALTALLDLGGIDLRAEAAKPIERKEGEGIGPRPESASSQQDADDLLADLGL